MKVTVRYIGFFRMMTARREETIELSKNATLRVLLRELGKKYGTKFTNQLFQNNQLREGVIILIDGKSINLPSMKGLNTRLKNQNLIMISHMISGG